MKKEIDLDTFGNTKACYTLVNILNDPKKMTKHYKEAAKLGESKSYFCAFIKNDYISKIEFFVDHSTYFDINLKLESFLKNINSYYCKKTIKG